jgi:hypothetical protein
VQAVISEDGQQCLLPWVIRKAELRVYEQGSTA